MVPYDDVSMITGKLQNRKIPKPIMNKYSSSIIQLKLLLLKLLEVYEGWQIAGFTVG